MHKIIRMTLNQLNLSNVDVVVVVIVVVSWSEFFSNALSQVFSDLKRCLHMDKLSKSAGQCFVKYIY